MQRLTPSRSAGAHARIGTWRALPVGIRDLVAGAALLVLAVLPLGIPGVELGGLHFAGPAWVPPILMIGQSLGLAFRRRAPAVALGITGLSFAASQLVGAETGVAGLGLFVAIYSAAAYLSQHRRAVGAAGVTGYVLLAVALHAEGSTERLIDWVTFFFVLLVPWFAGQLARRRTAEHAEREARAAQQAADDARALLARDLHDIVTHHVTAMVVQAESAGYLAPDEVEERARTFDAIGAAGRRALQELRSLLGALERAPGHTSTARLEPAPGDLASLVSEASEAGGCITLSEAGPTGDVSDAVAVTLYRVTQEALTNAMRHAPLAPVAISVSATAGSIELTIVNSLPAHGAGLPGRGLRGMAERVAVLRGTLTAGASDGEFRVYVRLDARAEP